MNEKEKYSQDPIGWMRDQVAEYGLEEVFPDRQYGVYRGIVIDVKDPQKRGRCRVQIPAVGHRSPRTTPMTIWATVAGATVGNSDQLHGLYFPFDEGDQVMVQFEGGELTSPVVTGGWVREDQTKRGKPFSSVSREGGDVRTEDGCKKAIRTKTGHIIEFDDCDGTIVISRGSGKGPGGDLIVMENGKITVSTKDGNVVTIGDTTVSAVAADGSTMSVGDGKATLENNVGTKLELDGANIEMKAAGDINMDAGKTINVKGTFVKIGRGILEPMLTGRAFQIAWQTHIHPWFPFATAPTVTPVVAGNGLSTTVQVAK